MVPIERIVPIDEFGFVPIVRFPIELWALDAWAAGCGSRFAWALDVGFGCAWASKIR